MGKITSERLALVLLAILFLSVNVIANGSWISVRLDLTEDGLYTLSEGTSDVLSHLEEPVTLRFFFSETLANNYPGLKTYGDRVREMLQAFEAEAAGNIELQIFDPEPFTEAEDQAVAYGLQGVPAEAGQTLYFGLAATSMTDDQEVITYFSPDRETFLEYDLTKAILGLQSQEPPTIGIFSALPLTSGAGTPTEIMQGQARPLALYQQLSELFTLRHLPDSFDQVPEEIDLLMLAAPPAMDEQTLYAVDQFALRGGRILAFVDPFVELLRKPDPMRGSGQAPAENIDNLTALLNSWGVDIPPNEVLADRRLAVRSLTRGAQGQEVVDYVIWLAITGQNVSASDIVTAEVNALNLGTAGHILLLEDRTTKVETLITSSSEAMLLEPDYLRSQPAPQDLLREFRPTGEEYVIAVRISGPANSAFPDGPPPQTLPDDIREDEIRPAHLNSSASGVNIILIADSDLFDDRFWITRQNFLGQIIVVPTADNGSLVINAVENLTGSGELISLRSRGSVHRPFVAMATIRQDAEFRYLAKEQALLDKLAATEARIQELGQLSEGGMAILSSPETAAEVASFRLEMLTTRKQLREVQRDLRQEIDSLQTTLKLINIALMPLLFGVIAFIIALLRRRRFSGKVVT